MSSIWGERLKISLFGESHGPGIGVVLDGFPPGLELDFEKLALRWKEENQSPRPIQPAGRKPMRWKSLAVCIRAEPRVRPFAA